MSTLREHPITVMLTKGELGEIEDLQFARRISSRGEMVRQLIDAGLRNFVGEAPEETLSTPVQDKPQRTENRL